MILRLLERRFGPLPAEVEGRVGHLSTEQLFQLMDVALEAASLATVEAFLVRLPAEPSAKGK